MISSSCLATDRERRLIHDFLLLLSYQEFFFASLYNIPWRCYCHHPLLKLDSYLQASSTSIVILLIKGHIFLSHQSGIIRQRPHYSSRQSGTILVSGHIICHILFCQNGIICQRPHNCLVKVVIKDHIVAIFIISTFWGPLIHVSFTFTCAHVLSFAFYVLCTSIIILFVYMLSCERGHEPS